MMNMIHTQKESYLDALLAAEVRAETLYGHTDLKRGQTNQQKTSYWRWPSIIA